MGRGKRLNIYVPADKTDVVERLRRLSKNTGKPIHQLVVDAIVQYLSEQGRTDVRFRSFHLKVNHPFVGKISTNSSSIMSWGARAGGTDDFALDMNVLVYAADTSFFAPFRRPCNYEIAPLSNTITYDCAILCCWNFPRS